MAQAIKATNLAFPCGYVNSWEHDTPSCTALL